MSAILEKASTDKPKSRAAYFREYRRRKKTERLRDADEVARAQAILHAPRGAGASAQDIIGWIETTLKVPTGPMTGRPFRVEPFQAEWLHGAIAPGIREAGMSIARKNGKSGFIAAVLLAGLVGPWNRRDWRAVVTSMTGYLAKELLGAIEQTAKVSGLLHVLTFRRAPPPGFVLGGDGSRVDFLAADKATGHAIGCDLALIDEAGLLEENHRALWNALFSSISGRNGQMWAISIQSTGPMFHELEERDESASVYFRKWAAPDDCALDDESAWHAANPGLVGAIKALEYMRDAAARAKGSQANELHFRVYDLNQPIDPRKETIVGVSDLTACVRDAPEPLAGDVVLGIDLGGSSSMTCAAAYAVDSGRLKVWGAFGDDPPLHQRAASDRMGALYDTMVRQGELILYPGKSTPVVPFLEHVVGEVSSSARIILIGADRYRKAEALDAFGAAGLPDVRVEWRGQGAHAKAHGSHDVRAFQRAVLDRTLHFASSVMFEAAVANSTLRFDNSGNPALDKASQKSRIDALSAAVIAVGLGSTVKPLPLMKVHVV